MPSKNKEKWLTPVSRMTSQRSGGHDASTAAPLGASNATMTTSTMLGPSNGFQSQQSQPQQQSQQSQPPQPPAALPHQMGGVDPISAAIMTANANPFVIGLFMLLLNLGGRFLTLELTKKQEAFLQAPWVRPFIFFTVVFIATRNLAAAFWVSLLFFFIIWVVANENSPFCMIPSWCGHDVEKGKKNYLKNIQTLF